MTILIKDYAVLLSDALCAMCGIATVSCPSVCNVEIPSSYKLGYFENNYTNN